ncbi:uncharacterized aarF domain-containing protein kinase At1g71810, chloroplastic-like [Cryptomeria japonica]|uniref:uncharacterized aarF domain-containing protein kinase At1g71810, chloroplastic-like n=1 Tax=Cryptomeria japonica TaxID=3369 RepID=UPI0027DAAAC6|nr:uncharacterized aarF domain-containing protein kinase At1g71810, chloroplastic-like [Cryptomeria japonica]
MITGAYSSSGTLTVTNIKSYISFYTHRKNNTNKNTKYIRVCATPPFSIPSEKNKKKKQVNRFWQIVKKDSEFVQKGIHWTREVGLPVLAKRIEGIFLLRNWEDPDAKLLPPLPWSKPHYPELTGTDLLAADVKSLKEYIDYLRGSLDMWRIPLQESYDPDQIAAYFNCRPHVLASRILEVSVAFASVIIKEKSEKALKLTRSFSNRKTNEIQSEYFTGEILKETMLKLGPTFVKVGQSISTRPDLVGQAIGKVLAELQDRLPPFPTAEARQIIEEELGCKVDEVFSSLSKDPVAAASFGQVYRGCTIEGEDVAVKVQRPNALYNVARDIYILRLLVKNQSPLTAISKEQECDSGTMKVKQVIKEINDLQRDCDLEPTYLLRHEGGLENDEEFLSDYNSSTITEIQHDDSTWEEHHECNSVGLDNENGKIWNLSDCLGFLMDQAVEFHVDGIVRKRE